MVDSQFETATLAGGCFWCTEAIFKRLKGIQSVTSGYAGGNVKNPSYEQVSMGNTGHAESIEVVFDPSIISFDKILDIFWHTHNPTTLNRQGNDEGPQYRSVIFYHDEKQKTTALLSKEELEQSKTFHSPIVTSIEPFTSFYPAEDYHKNYYDNNGIAPYCTLVITPKIKKLLEMYRKDVKEEYLHS